MYIKKEQYKGIKHSVVDKFGTEHILDSDETENDAIYENNKFMFDVIEEEKDERENIENQNGGNDNPEQDDPENDEIEETTEDENVIETKTMIEQVEELEIQNKKDIIEEINDCFTIDELKLIAEENEITIPKNIKKLGTFKEKLINEIQK